ncbi:hypothetical protein K7X08_024966 [Anisodus acutangulus]|uniref:Uncharacterized protein n=1 Tax=Anisodus acutangulus TaxID=402998 RepID=A0A9Q1RGG1_9SOLA|nr:hypothetical protein K7X08_024966 [Anisodus acutangulus]
MEQKEQSILMTQKLSMELVKMRKDLKQKEQILSAMLRKSKSDTAEKQMLMKEIKLSKAKRKQAELESERWKTTSEFRYERHSLRSMMYKRMNPKLERNGFDQRLKNSVAVEQRHNLELDTFAEQLRLKDEMLEAFRWRLLSMELESKRLRSHIEMKLDVFLLNREVELQSLKQQLAEYFHHPDSQKSNTNSCPKDQDKVNHTVWSNNHPKEASQKVKNGRKVETRKNNPTKDIILTLQSPTNEVGEGKDGASRPNASMAEHFSTDDTRSAETSTSECASEIKKKKSQWKMDLHALGHENDLNVNCEGSVIRKTKEETKMLEHFLEETFQLQRYIVATGQKLMEVQTKIASGFVGAAEELDTPASFDAKRFADGIRTIFREVQRGLEVHLELLVILREHWPVMASHISRDSARGGRILLPLRYLRGLISF